MGTQEYVHVYVYSSTNGTKWYTFTYVLIMLCHNFLIGKGHTCTVHVYKYNIISKTTWNTSTQEGATGTQVGVVSIEGITVYYSTYVRTYNFMSQLSNWKRAHMCTENHVCFGRIHGSQLREGANAGYVRSTRMPYPIPMVLPSTHVCTYSSTMVPWYHGTRVLPNGHTMVHVYVHVYHIWYVLEYGTRSKKLLQYCNTSRSCQPTYVRTESCDITF